jgi:predicted peroxiredoxin
MKYDFHQRRENRIAGAEEKASKSEAESDRLYQLSQKMADAIPIGQPILIGHHSEKSDRRYRDKISGAMKRSVEADNKAAYYADKADSIKNNDAIFSDDPEAVVKLEEKLNSLKEMQDFMKAANNCIRKDDKTAFLKLKYGNDEMWEELIQDKFWGKGFAHFTLTNNSANIRRIEKRVVALKKQGQTVAVDTVINGVRLLENREANRLQLFFDGKPMQEIIIQLKQHGFRWCRSEGAWQRHISNNALYWGRAIAGMIEA